MVRHGSGVFERDTADADNRKRTELTASGELLKAERVAGVRFCRGAEDGTDAEVVSAPGSRGHDLLIGLRGESYEQIRTGDASRILEGQVVDAEVDAGGAGGKRDIDAVVDDEWNAAFVAYCLEGTSEFEDVAIGAGLRPELDHRHAACEGLSYAWDKSAGNVVWVGDEVEAESIRHHRAALLVAIAVLISSGSGAKWFTGEWPSPIA